MNTEITIVMPLYNEIENIHSVIPQWCEFCITNSYLIIIVDDGSTDGSTDALKKYQSCSLLTIIRHKLNKGYGAALKTGIEHVKTSHFITVDADGQHIPDEVGKMINLSEQKNADLVIGRRDNSKMMSSHSRRIGKWLIRRFAAAFLHSNVKDLNSGMKLYNKEIVDEYIDFCPNTMAFSDVLTLAIIDGRHLVIECPVEVMQRKSGNAKTSFFTGIETIIDLMYIVVLFHSMRLFLPLSFFFVFAGCTWGLPIVLKNRGVSVGALLCILTGIISFYSGLLAEQISHIIKRRSRR